MTSLNDFLERIGHRLSTDSVFNPYASISSQNDRSGVDEFCDSDQMNNLAIYLRDLFSQQRVDLMLVGEAPGYHGCAQSGIPFTSRKQLLTQPTSQLKRIGDQLTVTNVISFSERSADAIWSVIQESDCNVLIWNAFPYHPHERNMPTTNRKPRADELREGQDYLQSLLDLFAPARVVSIGRVAERAVSAILDSAEFEHVRHPSFGGKTEFTSNMQRILAEQDLSN